jgi:hypothetical protein
VAAKLLLIGDELEITARFPEPSVGINQLKEEKSYAALTKEK